MRDSFGRRIDYLRLSLTDRCDLRCTYCMAERPIFLSRADLLTIDELDRVASAFIRLGVRKLRLTGGEPLVRKGAIDLVRTVSRHLKSGSLDELTLTTNGTQLAQFADPLAAAGVARINVSLDHLDPARFSEITRGGVLQRTLDGIDAAQAAGIKVKINTVVLGSDNLDHIPDLIAWAHGKQMTVTLIEVMPVGDIGADRLAQHVPMPVARAAIEARWPLADFALRTGGPARYARTAAGGIVGFITPLTANFCEGCNRVRVSADGRLHACLGHETAVDLKPALRNSEDDAMLVREVGHLLAIKPARHNFEIGGTTQASVRRAMSVTGG